MHIKSVVTATILAAISIGPAFTVSAATTKTVPEFFTPAESEAKVRDYFKDIPVMIEIARCESAFRQYTDNGTVLHGGASGGMVGVFQFFESVHAVPAKNLGFNLSTLDGNLGYARHLHKTEGTAPWNPAKDCWDVTPTKVVKKTTDKEALKQQIALLTKLISILQKQLQAKRVSQS